METQINCVTLTVIFKICKVSHKRCLRFFAKINYNSQMSVAAMMTGWSCNTTKPNLIKRGVNGRYSMEWLAEVFLVQNSMKIASVPSAPIDTFYTIHNGYCDKLLYLTLLICLKIDQFYHGICPSWYTGYRILWQPRDKDKKTSHEVILCHKAIILQ